MTRLERLALEAGRRAVAGLEAEREALARRGYDAEAIEELWPGVAAARAALDDLERTLGGGD